MFYSQFILAKKGPLGTIWIAAHLERKLRKNQVADTDIGVSVDSIICPEVPIALRLSSHLLLGVVRIYSRKVNYLFHDCSEALLKIKQAFRSTAVDLPPEESTAPYHSITLPETFDLDDFELPDAVIQGNFVDHHVSTREQITLQDKLENTAYTSSQFGLDERFGDGDSSQINLVLDEELFLKKDASLSNAPRPSEKHGSSLEDKLSAQPETPFTPFVNMDIDDYQEDHDEKRTMKDSTNIPSTRDGDFCQPNKVMEDPTNSQADHGGNFGQPNRAVEDPTNVSANSDANLCQPSRTVEDPTKVTANSDGNLCQPSRAVEDTTNIPANCDGNFPNLSHERMTTSDSSNPQGYNVRTPDLNAMVFPQESARGPDAMQNHMDMPCPANDGHPMDLLGPAQAPATPGLLEEAVPVHLQVVPLSHQGKSSPSNDAEGMIARRTQLDLECHDLGSKIDNSDLPLRRAADLHRKDDRRACGSVNNEVLHHELGSKIHNNMHGLDHSVTAEPHNVKHASEELEKMDNAPLTFNLSVDNKLASARSLETNSILPVDKPESHDASQHKPAVALDSSHSFHMVASDFDCPLQPCRSKDQIHAANSEDQAVGYDNQRLLTDTFAGDKVLKYGGPSSEVQGEGPSTIPVNDGSAKIMDDREQYAAGKRMLEPDGSARKYTVMPGSEQCPKPERTMLASTGPAAVLVNDGLSVIQTTENVTKANNCSANFGYSEPERVMMTSTSTYGFIDGMQQYIAGKGASAPGESAHSFPGLSGGEQYPAPAKTALASTGPAVLVNEGSLATKMTENVSASLGYPEPERVIATSRGPSSVLANDGSLATQTTENITQANNHSASFGYPELERVMLTLGGRSAILANDGSLATQTTENVIQANNRFAGFGYSEPERGMLTSRGPSAVLVNDGSFVTHMAENPTRVNNCSASFGNTVPERVMLTSGGPSVLVNDGSSVIQRTENVTQANNLSASFGYQQAERVIVASTSTSGFVDDGQLYISGKQMPEPDVSAHAYTGLSGREHYTEPERIMLASTSAHGLPSYMEQSTSWRDGNAHAYQSVPGKELSFGEGTPALLSGSTAKFSGASRSRRKVSYVPDDDDLLASILVGKKRASSSKAKDSQTLQLVPSSKRPRLTLKMGGPKRKVLVDEAMVLHADTIRQQLMSTDDIRRMRKKAPCTCLETWRIQKLLLEDEVFSESVLTGMSPELTSFQNVICSQNRSAYCRVDSSHSPLDSSKMAHPKVSEVTPRDQVESDNLTMADQGKDATETPVYPSRQLAVGVEDHTIITQGTAQPTIETPVHSNSHLAFESKHEPSHVSDVQGVEDHVSGIQDTARLTTEMPAHSNSHWAIKSQHEPPHVSVVDGIEDHIMGMQDTARPTTEMPVHSNSPLAIESQHKPSHVTVEHGVEDHVMDAHETTQPRFSTDNVTHSVLTIETNNSDYQHDKDVKISSPVGIDPCSISEPLLLEKENDREASTVTMTDEVIFNPSHRSFEETVHPNENNSIPAENACSVEDGPHVSESRGDVHDVINDTECTVIVTEEQPYPQQDSFEKAPDHAAPIERAHNSDGCPASENRSVIMDEVQLTSAANANEIEIREQQIDTASDNKDMSPCEKSQSFAKSDIITSAVEGARDAHEPSLETDVHMENAECVGAARDSCDLRSAVDENDHDTEFLNMDDEVDFDDEVDYDIPNPEEEQPLDNSGWSTRTRGVARYLKLLFDEETGYGKKDAQLDRLLGGKMRKEASRMFFETLVLKTKDYIHVEQDGAFGSIKIEPRSKLLKSTF